MPAKGTSHKDHYVCHYLIIVVLPHLVSLLFTVDSTKRSQALTLVWWCGSVQVSASPAVLARELFTINLSDIIACSGDGIHAVLDQHQASSLFPNLLALSA